uniref:Netrin module non-TIMP type domain-containing protein n=1 Tax=Pavo cristatus TaxID=9049 RepID=A0A8C9FUX9_PAVCR
MSYHKIGKICVPRAIVLLFIRKVYGFFSSHITAADESIQVGAHRQFLKRSSCMLDMVAGKRYLLMGKDGQTVDYVLHSLCICKRNEWDYIEEQHSKFLLHLACT